MSASELRHPVLEYRERLCKLSITVLQILAEGLPNGSRHMFDAFCEDPLAVVRLLHYPPQTNLTDKKQLGAGAHTDFGAITLLLQDKTGGLQVLNQSTQEWIDVEPNSEAYVVNVGDMLQVWTKGGYTSNTHRVINKSGGHRYSVPFFFDGNLEYVLKPLDGSTEEGVTVEEFMRERFTRSYPT
jgi:isopenicillin N synthase-like dioxygenase